MPAEEVGLELFAQHPDGKVFDKAGLAIGAIVEQRGATTQNKTFYDPFIKDWEL